MTELAAGVKLKESKWKVSCHCAFECTSEFALAVFMTPLHSFYAVFLVLEVSWYAMWISGQMLSDYEFA